MTTMHFRFTTDPQTPADQHPHGIHICLTNEEAFDLLESVVQDLRDGRVVELEFWGRMKEERQQEGQVMAFPGRQS